MLLAITALTMLWLVYGTSSALPREEAAPKGLLPRSITGMGETLEVAQKDAIREAVKQVSVAMQLHNPPLQSFKVNEDYVRTLLDLNSGHEGDNEKLKIGEHAFKAWVIDFRTDKNLWNDIVRKDQEAARHARAEERQKVGSLIIVGLGLLLLVGFGYVQLDEYTQRRYTTWLRLAGVGVASTLIAGWWVVFFQSPG
jgi:hypothetical protein